MNTASPVFDLMSLIADGDGGPVRAARIVHAPPCWYGAACPHLFAWRISQGKVWALLSRDQDLDVVSLPAVTFFASTSFACLTDMVFSFCLQATFVWGLFPKIQLKIALSISRGRSSFLNGSFLHFPDLRLFHNSGVTCCVRRGK